VGGGGWWRVVVVQADATLHRYHCARVPDVDVCAECFSAGKLPPGLTSADFLKMDPPYKLDTDPTYWSDQETMLLLEALEMFGASHHPRREGGGYPCVLCCLDGRTKVFFSYPFV
jgi:hypothetical protein